MTTDMSLFGDVAANLLAGGIGAGTMYLARDKLVPIIRGRFRQLPKLNNTVWDRVLDTPGVTSTITFRQSGTRIRAVTERRGQTSPRNFIYTGVISGHQLVMTWNDSASSEQLIGATVLHLSARLNRMEGFNVYFRHEAGKVIAVPCSYTRAITP